MIMATVVIFGEKLAFISLKIIFVLCVTLIQTTVVPAGQCEHHEDRLSNVPSIVSKVKKKVTIALTTLIYIYFKKHHIWVFKKCKCES